MRPTKPTGGEWELYAGHVVRAVQGENATPIADLAPPYRVGVGLVRGEREQLANGHLMAAAKQLLEACEAMRAAAMPVFGDDPEVYPAQWRDALRAMFAAIAKARGQ